MSKITELKESRKKFMKKLREKNTKYGKLLKDASKKKLRGQDCTAITRKITQAYSEVHRLNNNVNNLHKKIVAELRKKR